ncbi:MAG: RNA chaperone Hfq [Oscillospiraceae bacterium]|nr:RNA chaperone Hfq [Oscillospiraceae bacterium]
MKNTTHQEIFLNKLCQEQIACTLFLMNGFQMRGTILAHDHFVLIAEVDGRQQMIYKHAVSTICPHQSLDIATL